MGWKEKTDRAKKLHRPSLKNWERDGLHATFPQYASALLSPSAHPYSSFRIDTVSGRAMESSMSLNCARGGGPSRWSSKHDETLMMEEEQLLAESAEAIRLDERVKSTEQSTSFTRQLSSSIMYPVVLDAYVTTPQEFHDKYEANIIPVVIRNIPYGATATATALTSSSGNGKNKSVRDNEQCYDDFREEKKEYDTHHNHQQQRQEKQQQQHLKPWPALRRWSLSNLATDPHLRSRPLKCGEDDDGYTIRVKLRHFLKYLHQNKDDSPLYIFDATFDEDRYAKRLLEDYTVPEYFNEDLMGLVGERRRPPYRWFLVGPCRSGTTVHIDPLGTSAWNTLVHGVKRWVLFPPHVPKSVVKGRKLMLPGEDDEAIHYFCTILPRMKRRAAACQGKGEYANFECYEFTQYAGETVFVPHGWWHAVLNVTHTVGITQNYCSRRNFDAVWTQTRSGRKKMACTWLRRLEENYPDLAKRARELNTKDGFVMWEDDEVEQKKWRKKRAEKERSKREKAERKKREYEKKKDGEMEEGKCRTLDGKGDKTREVDQKAQRDGSILKKTIALNSATGYGSFGRESKRSRVDSLREVSPD